MVPGSGSRLHSLNVLVSLFRLPLYMCTSQPLRNLVYLPRPGWGKWRSTGSETWLGRRKAVVWTKPPWARSCKWDWKEWIRSRMQNQLRWGEIRWEGAGETNKVKNRCLRWERVNHDSAAREESQTEPKSSEKSKKAWLQSKPVSYLLFTYI